MNSNFFIFLLGDTTMPVKKKKGAVKTKKK
jgi:hypothetical protein